MKTITALILVLAVAAAFLTFRSSPEPVETVEVSAVVVPIAPTATPGDSLLVMVHRCATELFPSQKGSGGQPLRYDAMSLRPHSRHFGADGGIYELPEPKTSAWMVRIEEEHPHNQIPNGVEFAVNPDNGLCSRVPMD